MLHVPGDGPVMKGSENMIFLSVKVVSVPD